MKKVLISTLIIIANLSVRAETFSNLVVGTGSALGTNSVAEGSETLALGDNAHAEGSATMASGFAAHAEGELTLATGRASHAAGSGAAATNDNTYVWSDGMLVESTTNKQFTVYASNGIRLLGGPISGNGSGLTNLNANFLSGSIPALRLPNSGTWNAAGVTIQNANLAGNVHVEGDALTLSTNLTVQGALTAASISAAGSDGTIQFNQAGKLAGSDKLFIHQETGKPSLLAEEGNLLRVYKDGIVNGTNLIYSLREEGGDAVLRMFKNGQQTVQIMGDGTASFAGSLNVAGAVVCSSGTVGTNTWYIPQSGDLLMGAYIEGGGLSVAASRYVPDATDLSMGNYTQQ